MTEWDTTRTSLPATPLMDTLTSKSLYSGLHWNNAFAEADGRAMLHVVRHGSDVEGWAASHLLPQRTSNPVYDAPSIIGDLADGAPEDWYPQLLVGARNGQCNPANLLGDETQALSQLLDSFQQIEASSMAWLYADTQTAERLVGADDAFVPILSEMDCTIPVRFNDLDGYLQILTGKLRYGVRRDLKQSGGLPQSEVVGAAGNDLLTACAPLAVKTQTRHGASSTPEGMLRYLSKCVAAAEEAVIFYYGPREQPSAFSLALIESDRLWVRLVGLDYGPDGETFGRYPGVLAYGPAVFAAKRGLLEVNVGAGNSTFKRHRGAVAEPRWSLLKPPAGVTVNRAFVSARNEARATEWGLGSGAGILGGWRA